ncbi:MAG: isoaspartyl peptidase/L-asparaginase [Bacteroidetes bacterium]|nr:isoaspartyl peptidase/L-asparaginase [Bacteroidota bacterium]
MKIFKVFLMAAFMIVFNSCVKDIEETNFASEKVTEFGLVIHGGAGYIYPGRYSEMEERAYKEKLKEALLIGYEILKNNGTALDAVEKTIQVLEESPLFNAGIGAVLTSEKTVELDAAIMSGKNLSAGAVAGIKHIKSPISLARKIMENSPHVMMIGEGAEVFALQNGMEKVSNEYFITEDKLKEINKIHAEERKKKSESNLIIDSGNNKFGTVGCAALDKFGNLAAGTSTGGMANKRFGRVGDVPIIGAGTYANNKTCALSATGHGEFFIRNVVTHDISALMEYKNLSINKAASLVVMDKLEKQNGKGGVIGIDRLGNITMIFNTDGMFRGFITDKGIPNTALYKD